MVQPVTFAINLARPKCFLVSFRIWRLCLVSRINLSLSLSLFLSLEDGEWMIGDEAVKACFGPGQVL